MSDTDPDVDDRDNPTNEVQEAVERNYLAADEVADNFDAYLDALGCEMEMAGALKAGLESGRIPVDEMVRWMPSPTPLEAWEADEWRDLPADYDPTPTDPEVDDGE